MCWKATWAAILATVEPSTQTRMFSGLMSVWMIPQTLCRYDSPCSTCQVHTSQLRSKHYSEQYNQSKLDITIVTWSISFVVKGRRTPWYAGYCRYISDLTQSFCFFFRSRLRPILSITRSMSLIQSFGKSGKVTINEEVVWSLVVFKQSPFLL